MKKILFGYNITIEKQTKEVANTSNKEITPRFKILKKKIKQDESVEVENKLKKIWE